jgi:CubicO group peptidase (beta-lactamase class C family)
MTQTHLPGNQDLTEFGRMLSYPHELDGVGFGLGFSVTIDVAASKLPGSNGDYGWGGAASTTFWIDPAEDLTVVFMSQLLPSSTHRIRALLQQLVYQAIVD